MILNETGGIVGAVGVAGAVSEQEAAGAVVGIHGIGMRPMVG